MEPKDLLSFSKQECQLSERTVLNLKTMRVHGDPSVVSLQVHPKEIRKHEKQQVQEYPRSAATKERKKEVSKNKT